MACSGQVVFTRHLDRIVSADWASGVIAAESGVTLSELLALAIPRGWFLPVTPGTKYVTLGGAVANDVHGKNHHVRGTFGCHVRRLGLVRSDRGEFTCSADLNQDVFSATIGGLGLTGIITWVELQLMPIAASSLDETSVRFGSLSEFFSLSREMDPSHEYTVSWIDCAARAGKAGRGIFTAANHAPSGALKPSGRRVMSVPFTPPVSAINPLTLRLFNAAYYARHPSGRRSRRVDYDSFFYPLDSILHWNRIYGPGGLQQFQCVVPDAAAEHAIAALLSVISASGKGSFLAVLKRCGRRTSPGLISFPLPGISLALDFAQSAELEHTLLPRLDAIVHDAGGRLYPAKDAHMKGKDFRAAYPAWEALEKLRDPMLCSRFWARVTA